MTTFKVFCSGWGSSIEDAIEIEARHASCAAEEWAARAESDGGFADGYPIGFEVTVVDASGTQEAFLLDTDWSASFHAFKAEVPA